MLNISLHGYLGWSSRAGFSFFVFFSVNFWQIFKILFLLKTGLNCQFVKKWVRNCAPCTPSSASPEINRESLCGHGANVWKGINVGPHLFDSKEYLAPEASKAHSLNKKLWGTSHICHLSLQYILDDSLISGCCTQYK